MNYKTFNCRCSIASIKSIGDIMNNRKDLHIEVVENGFIVTVPGADVAMIGKMHVFTNASELGDFVAAWGTEKDV